VDPAREEALERQRAGQPQGGEAQQPVAKRAASRASGLTNDMFDKFAAHDKELFDKGILKTPHPQADQVFGGDEVGEDPTGARE
jgi:hypothetical protein